jgi:hypothetical protein
MPDVERSLPFGTATFAVVTAPTTYRDEMDTDSEKAAIP